MQHLPLITIGIPTRNRPLHLKSLLESILGQKLARSSIIEILVVDNSDRDDSKEVVASINLGLKKKIRYIQNSVVIEAEKNYIKVLRTARGELIKLQGDGHTILPGFLERLYQAYHRFRHDKTQIVFKNSIRHAQYKDIIYSNPTDVAANLGVLSTWITSISVWRSDLPPAKEDFPGEDQKLISCGLLFSIATVRRTVVINGKFFKSQSGLSKGGYDFLTVFLDNYPSLVSKYCSNSVGLCRQSKLARNDALRTFVPVWAARSVLAYQSTFNFKGHIHRVLSHPGVSIVIGIRYVAMFYILLPLILIVKLTEHMFRRNRGT